ncbi:tryptophan halogenase family protein [Saccharophagus degradans]|uniref:Tryptophan halogenase n=1 Tax=Saccharophagus degradans (strain 2-40 / ATCC 43961 / DSM 17024) TaxID=203122 RepID=Q21LS1_SACD2|nr:tryptophan halogenase family protein [Saccharophagus degradans]ABD80358.1 tryptophan halogenase [Saccharophagus degradans 2-40]
MNNNIKKILIVGGGTAGWMAAAAMGKLLKSRLCDIELIESEEIGTVGVGEATIPQLQLFNKLLEIDEDEFVRETSGSFKLGIQFVNWGEIGSSYIHAFGDVGKNMEGIPFYHYWLRAFNSGLATHIDDYTLSSLACHQERFMRSVDAGNSPLSNIAYAYHFDATKYAKYLRKYAESKGVVRTEGKVVETVLHDDGFIKGVRLESGEFKEADLFVDCSGFRGLLIEEALKTGYEDWSHWLPCNAAVAVGCESSGDPLPYTRATAHSAGWQWRIPLQHRIGNGHVFCEKYMGEDEATSILLNNLDGAPIGTPRTLRFKTGHRKKFWNKNCVTLGLASGFMEPLESTSIHLVQTALAKLFSFFPNKNFDEVDIDEYNRQTQFEYERIRDFLILHYCATNRNDSEFWNYCRTMDLPEALVQKMDQFKCNGRIFRHNYELFSDLSWFEVMLGQGIMPSGYSPLVDVFSDEELKRRMDSIKGVVQRSVEKMPKHQEFINLHCKV